MTKIVVLDGYTLNPGDLNWNTLQALGEVEIYDRTDTKHLLERAAEADILVVNKQIINAEAMSQLPALRFIAVSATGYNNVDIAAARQHGIQVSNVVGYSTPAVVQQVFALLLALINKVAEHHQSVHEGKWSQHEDFSYTLYPIPELTDLTMGIYGLGRIGQAVAKAALAFGMKVLAHHKHPQRDAMPGVSFVDLEELFAQSNIVSLHAPLSAKNEMIVDKQLLSRMPQPSYLINTGRGGLINEQDVLECLQNGTLTGAGLDVLSQEPPPDDHPLLQAPNCVITPHLAWATQAARKRLLNEVVLNIQAFLNGQQRNSVV
ncbi:MAG: D-2-hydroxyacid dehydrogenase [Bacteroidota bacterium]